MATNITEFSYRVAPEVQGCPLALINLKVVDAIIQFCKDTYVLKYAFEYAILSTDVDTSDNDAVTLDLSTISGAPYTNKRPHDIIEFRIDTAPFKVQHAEMSTDITNLDNIRYSSQRFFNFPSSTTIKIFPLEAQDQTLYLEIAFKPVKGITTIDDFMFEDHNEPIEALAKYDLLDQKNKPWSNHKQALEEWDKYAEKMGRAKIDVVQGRTQKSTMIQSKYIF
ncbi:MAG: hypothetical protein ACYSU6_01310 [Planctomycetota bacterium]|jgi:hypothetical protein